jgi:hypothetical protein
MNTKCQGTNEFDGGAGGVLFAGLSFLIKLNVIAAYLHVLGQDRCAACH